MARAPRMTPTDQIPEAEAPATGPAPQEAPPMSAMPETPVFPAPTPVTPTAPDPAAPRAFDAFAHLRKIRTRQGMQDYLDVKWRVAWVRAEHPTAQIVTEQVEGDAQHARFKCTITLPNGAVATGHGSETAGDFPDFYEKAETKAIGRACASLGYGTDSASDFDDGEPLDGRAAAKDERAARTAPEPAAATPRRETSAPPAEPANAERNDNVTPIAQGRTRPVEAAPSRLPATRRMPAPPVSGGNGTGTHGPAPTADDRSNIHQHTQLRALADNGFGLSVRLATFGLSEVEELTREQAKELILAGRAATSGAHALH